MFHSSQGRRTSEGAPTSPTSPTGIPPHLEVGDHTQPESMAIVSMSEVEKHEDWLHVNHDDVPPNIEGAHGYQQVC